MLRENSGSVLWHYQGAEREPSSITVVQGVLYPTFYVTSGVNTITALRASDGFVLWHYAPDIPVTQLLPVMGEDLILITLQDGSIDALRASNDSLRWHRVM